jgi:hypothetical protein
MAHNDGDVREDDGLEMYRSIDGGVGGRGLAVKVTDEGVIFDAYDDGLGDSRLVGTWAKTFDEIHDWLAPCDDDAWTDDSIQFPRLLAEIMATQDEVDFEALSESMGLALASIDELFERANTAWELAKDLRTVASTQRKESTMAVPVRLVVAPDRELRFIFDGDQVLVAGLVVEGAGRERVVFQMAGPLVRLFEMLEERYLADARAQSRGSAVPDRAETAELLRREAVHYVGSNHRRDVGALLAIAADYLDGEAWRVASRSGAEDLIRASHEAIDWAEAHRSSP